MTQQDRTLTGQGTRRRATLPGQCHGKRLPWGRTARARSLENATRQAGQQP